MVRGILAVAVLSMGTLSVPSGAALALEPKALQSHRAVYDLSLHEARHGSGVEGIKGRLVLEYRAECAGAIMNQRILTQLQNTEGGEVLNDYRVSSWESWDGLSFRYSYANDINTNTVERIEGLARLSEIGQAGKAMFKKPPDRELDLPAGTVFPTVHTARLLSAAERGEPGLDIVVFDGSGIDGLFRSSAFIGERSDAAPEAERSADLAAKLGGHATWRTRLAYFDYAKQPATPDFEIGFRMYANGVSGDLVIDYGDFAIAGALSELTYFSAPEC